MDLCNILSLCQEDLWMDKCSLLSCSLLNFCHNFSKIKDKDKITTISRIIRNLVANNNLKITDRCIIRTVLLPMERTTITTTTNITKLDVPNLTTNSPTTDRIEAIIMKGSKTETIITRQFPPILRNLKWHLLNSLLRLQFNLLLWLRLPLQ